MAKESTFDLFRDDLCLSTLFDESEKDHESTSDLFCDDICLPLLFDESENDHEATIGNDHVHDQVFPTLDAKYAEELQLQEAIMASMDTSPNSDTAESYTSQESLVSHKEAQEDAKEVGESSHSFCDICAERKGSDEMFTIESCSHFFCTDCISKHIAIKIQDSVQVVTCPGLDCKVSLEIDTCRSIVPSNLLDRWNEVLCESMIPASQRFYCPYKDCSALLVKDSDEAFTESECPICHRLVCAECCVPWHDGVECEEFQRLDADERGREDLMVRMLAKEKEWTRCPSCKFFVEKTEGCIHMTCRCGFQFCYACGATWTSTHGGCRP